MSNKNLRPETIKLKAVVFFIFLVCLTVLSALFLVFSVHELRQMHTELDETQRNETRELARNSRLLLEKSTLAGLNEVESVALRELGMEFPHNLAEPSQ